jgi:hypothetical protein
MKPDLYVKTLLTVIALLLAAIACQPALAPRPADAAGHQYEVLWFTHGDNDEKGYNNFGQRVLDSANKEAQQGWELVAVIPSSEPRWDAISLIFRK